MALPDNYATEQLFGLPYPTGGGEISAAVEQDKTAAIARVLAAMLGAVGIGIVAGGVGTIVDGDLHLTASSALVSDELGCVPVADTAQVIAAAQFAEGTNYVHLQADETARVDGACGYYVSGSATPATGAVLVCQVTVTGGVLTAVDNSVRVPPAIVRRIAWPALVRAAGSAETLLEFVTAALGEAYVGATPPASVDDRLSVVEAGGGSGGTGLGYWGTAQRLPGDPTQIPQYVTALLEALKTELQAEIAAGGTGAGSSTAAEPWDVDGANQSLALLAEIGSDNPAAGDTQRDSAILVPGVREGCVDWAHTTWTTGLTGPA